MLITLINKRNSSQEVNEYESKMCVYGWQLDASAIETNNVPYLGRVGTRLIMSAYNVDSYSYQALSFINWKSNMQQQQQKGSSKDLEAAAAAAAT